MRFLRSASRDQIYIGVLVAIAIILRIASFAYLSSLAQSNPAASPYPIIAGDSTHYAHWADSILSTHTYQETPGTPKRGAPPGYSALLAATKGLTGSFTPIAIIQTILSLLALSLIYMMARTALPRALALIPALIYAIDPMTILADTTVLTDSVFSSLMIAIVYLAFFRAPMRGAVRWSLVGLLLGVAAMLRPISQFLIVVFPVLYLVRAWLHGARGAALHRALRSAAGVFCLSLITFSVVVVPWMIRNEIYFHSFEISNLGSHNLLTNDVRGFLVWRALAHSAHPLPAILVMRHVGDPIFATVDQMMADDLATLTPHGGDPLNYEGALAMRYIASDPIGYAYFHSVNTIPFFVSSSIASYEQIVSQLRDNEGFFAPVTLTLMASARQIIHPQGAVAFMTAVASIAPIALEILWWVVVTMLALVALVLWRRKFVVLLFAMLVIYFAALTGPLSDSRYRIPAEPYLITLAAVGIAALQRRSPRSQ